MNNSEWITDRLPTAKDSDKFKQVWRWNKRSKTPVLDYFSNVELGTPWHPIVKPPTYKKNKWKPKIGDTYWFLLPFEDSYMWVNDETDNKLYNIHACFKTKEEAEQMAIKIQQLLKDHHDGR